MDSGSVAVEFGSQAKIGEGESVFGGVIAASTCRCVLGSVLNVIFDLHPATEVRGGGVHGG